MEQSIPSCTAVQCTRGRARWPRGRATGAGGIWRHPGGGTRTNGQKPPPHLVTPEPIPISPNLRASTPPCPICSAATSSLAISLSPSTRRVHPFLTAPVGRPVRAWGERASLVCRPPVGLLRLVLELTAFRASRGTVTAGLFWVAGEAAGRSTAVLSTCTGTCEF